MGTDIWGWVEVKYDGRWHGLFKISSIVDRNYDMFGLLFGVRNYAGFKPIAPDRGIPEDASWLVLEDWEREYSSWCRSPTWISYKEIKSIDWKNIRSKDNDDRIHIYEKVNGEWKYKGKVLYMTELSECEWVVLKNGSKIIKGNKMYVYEPETGEGALDEDWKLLFDILEVVAKRYGEENVRLVVWFDS